MAIDRETVLSVAKLAHLELSEAEVERLTSELGNILGYIDELSRLDTSDVEPTTHVAVSSMPLSPDVPRESLDHERVLREAPRTANEGFAVPAFVDES
jgi:aspartyl-tRNA(Asn)/glutamyl-tRNA(Gln) amidotransferase subunit C